MNELTLGEYRVGKSFNPSKNPLVDQIKEVAAELIDLIEIAKTNDLPADQDTQLGIEYELSREKHRLATIAQDQVESAAMFAVKAATKTI